MSDLNSINRRDFLGAALFGPAVAAALGALGVDERPIYRGGMSDLIARSPPSPNWRARYYALVESVDIPESEWRVHWGSVLASFKGPGVDLAELLRANRVTRLCETEYAPPRPCIRRLPTCMVAVRIFESVAACEAVWRERETWIPGEISAHPGGLGEEAREHTRGFKSSPIRDLYFRRANVMAKVGLLFYHDVPGYEVDRFAADLDRHVAAQLG